MQKRKVARTIQEKFEAYVVIDLETGCWNWTAAKTRAGYGETGYQGKMWYSHRLFYTHHKGPIPEGLTLDHLCRNRACCNPDHLEAVTNKENILRGEALSAKAARRNDCLYGHPLDGKTERNRFCRTCEAYRMYKKAGGTETLEDYTVGYNERKAKRLEARKRKATVV